MEVKTMIDHVKALIPLVFPSGKGVSLRTAVDRARAYWRDQNIPCNPMGVGNRKTRTISTYNRVGQTCSSDCPWLDKGCLAQRGYVTLAQSRATPEGRIAAATTALVVGAMHGQPARLHISGDFMLHGVTDWVYIAQVTEVAEYLISLGHTQWLAWCYTASPDPISIPGVAIRRSNTLGPLGAIVRPHDQALPPKAFKCREQVDGTPCTACGLCWNLPNYTVVFDPSNPTIRRLVS